MKKKISVSLLLVFIITCLAGCGGKLTAVAVLKRATEKQQSMTSIDSTGKISVKMEMGGRSGQYDADVSVQAVDIREENMQMAMRMDMKIFGESMSVNSYYKEGYYYTTILRQKVKMPMDIGEIQEKLRQSSAVAELPMEAYKSLEMTEEGGNRVLTFCADGSKLAGVADSVLSNIMPDAADKVKDWNITPGDVRGTLTVDKDFNIIGENIEIDMSAKVDTVDIKGTYGIDMTINNPGEEVTLQLPDNLDSYEEIPE